MDKNTKMSEVPPIGALWIGGSLTWLEQLCLTSFVAHGHEVRLFTYGDVKNVPSEVQVCDGRDILDTKDFIVHDRTQSVALFSDLFRFHMIKAMPEIIYVDTDVFCLKPLVFSNPYLFGYEVFENENAWRLNGAVLRLPAESQLLHQMLAFMSDLYPNPAWLPQRLRERIRIRAEQGDPVHVAEMPWGIWGPLGITGIARETGEWKHAEPVDTFYPVPFPDRRVLYKRPGRTRRYLTENSATIHMWAPIKRFAASRFDGLCPENSFAGQQLAKYGIDPAKAPVPKTTKREVVHGGGST